VHEQYAITPRIFVTAGARVQQSNVFGTEFTPRGSITYRAPTDTFFRFSASRGITEPSLEENFANETFFVGNRNLKPEKTASYEVGLFHEWFKRRLRTDVAFFRNSFHDLIEFDFTNFPGTWANVDRSWARGGQGSASFRINHFTQVRSAYTRNYTRITGTNSTDLGQQLLRQPLNSGSISVELTPRKFAFIIGARFVGERRDDDFVFGINRAQGYEYVYMSGSWQMTPHLAPFVRIENTADETYQEALGYAAITRAAYGGLKLSW
jgi:outer membrane receptor protein involved in Fe transport